MRAGHLNQKLLRGVGNIYADESLARAGIRPRRRAATLTRADLHRLYESLQQVLNTGVPHISVYILEVDEESRLGRELIAGGTKYHAHHVPDADLAADLYLEAIDFLNLNGIQQYEISNFARAGRESIHNLKYWTRQPYIGFGLDAHSMLPALVSGADGPVALRLATTDDLDPFLLGAAQPEVTPVSKVNALEESMFLGLRLNAGSMALKTSSTTRISAPESLSV